MLKKWITLALSFTILTTPLMGDGTYTNTQKRYTITFPSNWTQSTNASGPDVTFLAPPDALNGTVNATASVISTATPPNTTLQSYVYQNLGALQSLTAFNEEDSGVLYINGQEAQFIVYNYQDVDGAEWTAIQFFLFKNPTAFLITCTALSDAFPNYLPTFKAIANSFKIQ